MKGGTEGGNGTNSDYSTLCEAIVHGTATIETPPGDPHPSIVAIGLPVSAMQQVLRLTAALALGDGEHELYPASPPTVLSTPAFFGIMDDDDALRVLEDIEVDMAAATVGVLARNLPGAHTPQPNDEPNPQLPPDTDGQPPVSNWTEGPTELNAAVPAEGWKLPHLGVGTRGVTHAPSPISSDGGSRPHRRATEPGVLFVNGFAFGLLPSPDGDPGDERALWHTTPLKTDPERVKAYRDAYLSHEMGLRPARSQSPPRRTLLAAAREHVSSAYAEQVATALSEAPITRRRAHAGGRPPGGRPIPPALDGIEPFLVVAAVEGTATRGDIIAFCEAAGLGSQSTVHRTTKRLVDAGMLELVADPEPDGRGRPSSVYRLGPEVQSPAPVASAAIRAVAHAYADGD
jgi:DNA-binding transcriptional ArsR family regulator